MCLPAMNGGAISFKPGIPAYSRPPYHACPQPRETIVPSRPNAEYGPVATQSMANRTKLAATSSWSPVFTSVSTPVQHPESNSSSDFILISASMFPVSAEFSCPASRLHPGDCCCSTISSASASSISSCAAFAVFFCYCHFCSGICFGCNVGSSFRSIYSFDWGAISSSS